MRTKTPACTTCRTSRSGLARVADLSGRTLVDVPGPTANLLAGLLILALGCLGVGGRLLRWLPLPITMGMLAGSLLGDVSRSVEATAKDGLVAGATVLGYALGRLLRSPRVPPVGLALLGGAAAVVLSQRLAAQPIARVPPVLVEPPVAFTPSAFVAVSLPLVVLSMGLGNVQGLGFLVAQGYRVPVNVTTVVLGLTTMVNALFGGDAALVSRNASGHQRRT